MFEDTLTILQFVTIGFAAVTSVGAIFFYIWTGKLRRALLREKKILSRRLFEVATLKELGERIGYSLNIEQIVDMIMGTLHQLIDYTAVSYMLLEPEYIVFKSHLERSANRQFIDDVRDRMLKSLSALLGKEFTTHEIREVVSGALLVEEMDEPVRSYFNIPLVIADKVVGVMTVTHTKSGLYVEEEMAILYKIIQLASHAVTRLQEVVQIEQRKLNSMVESMSDGVIMTDQDYKVLVVNPAAKAAIGVSDVPEPNIFNIIDHLEGKFDIRGKLEESVRMDRTLETPDVILGDRSYRIFVMPVKSSVGITRGELLGSVAILHDITHDKELAKMREDFTSMMVHELRSPLDGIKKRVEVLRDEKNKNVESTQVNEFLVAIHKNSSDMLELVNDLLDAAKLEAGKFDLHRKPASIRELIDDRVEFYSVTARDARIDLTSSFDNDLPAEIPIDPIRVSQVLNNLISNAIKFTDAGGKVSVQAFMHKNGEGLNEGAKRLGLPIFLAHHTEPIENLPDSVIVAISDSGIGIAEKNLELLFNKFEQFEARVRREDKKGTGLGLAIAKGIVEGHNGVIGVSSEDGNGSTFYFTLPLTL